jgi:hypothetical protein
MPFDDQRDFRLSPYSPAALFCRKLAVESLLTVAANIVLRAMVDGEHVVLLY